MKTETNIAESHIEELDFDVPLDVSLSYPNCQEHKASCQRDIPRLKKIKESVVYVENELTHHLLDEIILDKENAIRKYTENGI